MNKQELFVDLLEHVEAHGELPKRIESLTKEEYLQLITEDERSQLDDAISNFAEQAWESNLSDFYGSSSPKTWKERQEQAAKEKSKLRR